MLTVTECFLVVLSPISSTIEEESNAFSPTTPSATNPYAHTPGSEKSANASLCDFQTISFLSIFPKKLSWGWHPHTLHGDTPDHNADGPKLIGWGMTIIHDG